MDKAKPGDKKSEPPHDTPGRPKSESSRQQRNPETPERARATHEEAEEAYDPAK